MASSMQSNPVYYSLASLTSGQNSSSRTVVLQKRADHNGFGIYIGEDIPSGIYIVTVERNSPASEANIQPGDRVIAVNGQLVSSMTTNPKQMLIQAATNAQNLTLTIQSTNIFQNLNLPLTNSSKDNHHPNKNRYSLKQPLDMHTDLESYIKSLFANENVQILPMSNDNNFFLKNDPYAKSSMNFGSLPTRYYQPSDQKKERRHHHHHHHRSKRATLLQTKETQTSINDDEDENMSQEQLQTSATRPYPSMGTSQRIIRTQQQNSNDDKTQEAKPLPTNTNSEFTAIPSSPTLNNASPYSTTHQSSLPALTAAIFTASSATPNNGTTKNTNFSTQHMADIVSAAMAASRKPAEANSPEQVPTRDEISANKQPTPPQRSRETVALTKQTAAPPSSREPSENRSRESAPVTNQGPTSSQNQYPPPPPPYTETANTNPSSESVKDRDSTNAGSYNVRTAGENQSTISSGLPPGLREVHLQRLQGFPGFGFHLQYNRSYYLVQRIEANSPAEQSGLHANDVILSINEQRTDTMPHDLFVQIVNANTDVHFLVQSFEDYIRANPQPIRNHQVASTVAASITDDTKDRKSGLSKALGKITSR